jgi:glycosyltransferase involved in cell wall biosynthesis
MHIFQDTTLLITHYNRSESLERLLTSFEDLNCRFGDIVVSDDGSKPEHLTKVKSLANRFNFTLVTTPVNKGLGNNINKGQDAVKTPYTLYVQEDFQPPIFFLRISRTRSALCVLIQNGTLSGFTPTSPTLL